eukprot:6489027-Lingulodinium_polyedra.AAC.1
MSNMRWHPPVRLAGHVRQVSPRRVGLVETLLGPPVGQLAALRANPGLLARGLRKAPGGPELLNG